MVVAAVLLDEGGVLEVDTRVDVGHDDALAQDAVDPRLIGADLLDAPLGITGRGEDRDLGLDRLDEGVDLRGTDRLHAADLGQLLGDLVESLRVAFDDEDVGQPVGRGLDALGPGDRGLGGLLGGGRGVGQRLEDGGAALVPLLDLFRCGQIRLGVELHEDLGRGAGLELLLEALVDGRWRASLASAAWTRRGRRCGGHLGQDEEQGDEGRQGTVTRHAEHPSNHRPSPVARFPGHGRRVGRAPGHLGLLRPEEDVQAATCVAGSGTVHRGRAGGVTKFAG